MTEPLFFKEYARRLRHEPDYFQQEVDRHLFEGAVVLDAGCGSGEFGVLRKCGDRAGRIIGMDISAEALARNQTIDESIVGSLDNIPLESSSIDLIVCESVFEHLEHPQPVFSEFSRVLKRDGVLVMRTFNKWNWANFISACLPVGVRTRLKGHLLSEDSEGTFETYYRCNTRKRLQQLCANAGLREEKFITFGAWPGYWSSRFMVSLFALYEKVTDFGALRKGKVLIVGVYRKC